MPACQDHGREMGVYPLRNLKLYSFSQDKNKSTEESGYKLLTDNICKSWELSTFDDKVYVVEPISATSRLCTLNISRSSFLV